MKRIDLVKVEHTRRIGDLCPLITPNVTEDSIFYVNGHAIGFYVKSLSQYSPRMAALADLANTELRSDRVPKSTMARSNQKSQVKQFSTIIGSCPPRPHMRRPYPTRSSVHSVRSADNFIKAMLALCFEGEELMKKILPAQFEQQKLLIEKNIPEKWRFGRLFTSSISNYNIPAAFHRDAANLEGCSNIIITKRKNAVGGNLHVPDYGATLDSSDNSMLVYPAWRNLHGVTPIVPTSEGGYRNSLVFYPLKAFKDC